MKPVNLKMKAFGSYVKEEIHFAAENFDYGLVEDIMYSSLGLEMDYIFELLI